MSVEKTPVNIDRFAHRMLEDYDARTPGTAFAESVRLTLSEARTVQDTVAALRIARGEQVVGYKIGCVCPENQRSNGLTSPVWGRLWSSEQHADGAELDRRSFASVAIEGEFAVSLAEDINPESATFKTISMAIGRVFPVIELHNLVLRGASPTGAELIANNAIHAGIVQGRGVDSPLSSGITNLSIEFDGDQVDRWDDIRWPDGILHSVSWLVESLGASGVSLKRGQIVLTGALGPPLPVANVRHVQVKSSRFGDVAASFE